MCRSLCGSAVKPCALVASLYGLVPSNPRLLQFGPVSHKRPNGHHKASVLRTFRPPFLAKEPYFPELQPP